MPDHNGLHCIQSKLAAGWRSSLAVFPLPDVTFLPDLWCHLVCDSCLVGADPSSLFKVPGPRTGRWDMACTVTANHTPSWASPPPVPLPLPRNTHSPASQCPPITLSHSPLPPSKNLPTLASTGSGSGARRPAHILVPAWLAPSMTSNHAIVFQKAYLVS